MKTDYGKKSVTLTELVIAATLMGAFVLAAFGLFNAASHFYTSSDDKSVLLNELAFVLDHIDKEVYQAAGHVNRPAIVVSGLAHQVYTVTIRQFDRDHDDYPDHNHNVLAVYSFHTEIVPPHLPRSTVRFRRWSPGVGWTPWETLSRKLVAPLVIRRDPATLALVIDDITFRLDPNTPYCPNTNPRISAENQSFSSWMQSIN